MRRLATVAAVALMGVHPASAVDPQTEATRLRLEGKQLGDAGQLEEAILRFRAATALHPLPIDDCNIGLAYAKLKRWPIAHQFLERCRVALRESPPPWLENRLRTTLEALRSGSFAPVDVVVEPPGAQVTAPGLGIEDAFTVPRVLWLPFGVQELIATKTGWSTERQRIEIQARAPVSVRIVLQPLPPPPAPPAEAAAKEPAPPPEPPKSVAPAPPPPSIVAPKQEVRAARRRAFIGGEVSLGGGLALLAAGLAVHLVGVGARDQAAKTPAGPDYDRLVGNLSTDKNTAIALYTIGAAATVVGTALLIAFRPRAKRSLEAGLARIGLRLRSDW